MGLTRVTFREANMVMVRENWSTFGIALLFGAMLGFATTAVGQDNGGNGDNVGGISIDADGVVSAAMAKGRSAGLDKRQREAFAAAHLSSEVQGLSELRKVSLPRLEAACAEALAAGGGGELPEEMRYLAGLQRIDYVFVDPEGRDVILAGPAEGFAPDGQGRMVGLSSGRPPIQLDDLISALRAVLRGRGSIGCSIDPQQDRVAALQDYIRNNSSATTAARAKARYKRMAEILGLQEVTAWGVPEDSHYALALVEADFRMKRISLGLEPAGVRGIRSHLALLSPRGNSMQRWWFAPYYEAIYTDESGLAYAIAGQRVQVMAQEERVDADGDRSDAAVTRASTQRFAKLFTEHYEELAAAEPVFAELQNLFDLAVVSALLRSERVLDRTGWSAEYFLDEEDCPIASYPVPRSVASQSVTRSARGGSMLGLIGGVTLNPRSVARESTMVDREGSGVAVAERERALGGSDVDGWWWD
ncbi:MAG: DUF1598 domain-containing protein [Planctomycetota bacterium]|nr:MAG: DUF1598 domain-containing protein [Planctomycetota bacterium]